MIDEQVAVRAKAFQRTWEEVFKDQPRYALDFTWPSVGVLDLLTYPLRGLANLDESQYQLVQGVAAYLAIMAHRCWASFPDKVNVEAKLSSETGEILIAGRDGRFLRHGKEFVVPLTRVLLQILRDPPQPFPYFEQSTRDVSPDHNLLSLFAAGLFTGMCPFGEGSWRDHHDYEMTPYLLTTEEILVESCVDYYERVFPAELLGRSPRLYKSQLIFPPALHREPFPALHATVGLARHLKNAGVSNEEMIAAAMNLAYSPDELISSAGYAVSVALSPSPPSLALRMLSESNARYIAELRPAIVLARKVFGVPHDLTLFIEKGEYDKALPLAILEQQLGLLPLVRLRLSSLSHSKLRQLWLALIWGQTAPARIILEQLMEQGVTTTELELQQIFLDINLGDFERARAALGKFTNGHSITDPEDQMNFLELRGIEQFERKEIEGACNTFRGALTLKTELEHRYISIANSLALGLMILERYEDALDVLDAILKRDESSVPARANRIDVLQALGRNEEAARELLRLSRFAPTDRRVFAALIAEVAGEQDRDA